MPDYTKRQLRFPFVTGLPRQRKRQGKQHFGIDTQTPSASIEPYGERLELTDPRMCHRCGIHHRLWRLRKHCVYCRAELDGVSLMPLEPRNRLEPEPGFAMGKDDGLRLMFRQITHQDTAVIISKWYPVNPYHDPLTVPSKTSPQIRTGRWYGRLPENVGD